MTRVTRLRFVTFAVVLALTAAAYTLFTSRTDSRFIRQLHQDGYIVKQDCYGEVADIYEAMRVDGIGTCQLRISRSFLNESIPLDFSAHSLKHICKRVISFRCQSTVVDDSNSQVLAELEYLRDLSCDFESLSDDGCMFLSRLKHLRVLELNSRNVGDDGLANVIACKSLRTLKIGNTGITDDFIEKIVPLGIQTLHVENTELSNDSVRHLSKMDKLAYLNMSGTEIGSESASFWKHFTKLKSVDLRNTRADDSVAIALSSIGVEEVLIDNTMITESGANLLQSKGIVTSRMVPRGTNMSYGIGGEL